VGVGISNVWAKIWQGAIGISSVIFQGALELVNGDVWELEVETNHTYPTGEVNYTVYANDTLNNTEEVNGTITIQDTILPTWNFSDPTIESGNYGQNAIWANVSSGSLDLGAILISLYNSTNDLINSSLTTTSPNYVNFTGHGDGIYYLNATLNDTVGNNNYTETRVITLDTINPNLTINTPLNQTYNNDTILVNLSSSDTNLDTTWFYNGTDNETYTTPVYRVFSQNK